MNIILKQGEDVQITLLVLDKNNSPVNLVIVDKIRLSLSIKGLIVKKYMDTVKETTLLAGYSVCTSTVNSTVVFDILREDSAAFPIGELYVNVLLESPDVELTLRRTELSYKIGEILKGEMKTEQL